MAAELDDQLTLAADASVAFGRAVGAGKAPLVLDRAAHPVEAPKTAAAFTVFGLSATQLIVAVTMFLGALAGFLLVMMRRSRIGG